MGTCVWNDILALIATGRVANRKCNRKGRVCWPIELLLLPATDVAVVVVDVMLIFCVCQQMPIFMVSLPALGGSLATCPPLLPPATHNSRLSRAINLQKWPGPAAFILLYFLFIYIFIFCSTRVRDATWQSVQSAQLHSLSMAAGDSLGGAGEGRATDAPASGAPAKNNHSTTH